MQKFHHNISFWEKRQFFRRKLSKIAENCDHNIDPRSEMCQRPRMLEKDFWKKTARDILLWHKQGQEVDCEKSPTVERKNHLCFNILVASRRGALSWIFSGAEAEKKSY
jgi:hypothetical protein